MAKKRADNKKGTKSFWHQLKFKYKLSFFNEGTLEEVWSFRLSQLSVITTLAVFAFILITITSILIITTPIRNYLPGYLDVEVRKEIVQNALRADSLERMIAIQSLYMENMSGILAGTIEIDSIQRIDSLAQTDANYEIPRGSREEAYITAFEEEERYNLTVLNPNPIPADAIFFYKPVNGVVSAAFNSDIGHFGIDLVAAPSESVLATLDGTVVYTGFDPQFGNVLHIQHKNGFVSIYKHNDLLLKKIGDHVDAGDAIALLGNTGELSTGPHLHFELWYRGTPINPAEYIAF
ncbi:M23 family metallopeptidase [Parabacteroides sp. PF5-9]|uniref:M23 family metallopeptidase n=1 Tax=Parabacteroides sp. PF5-9 TaxID=1742404 RepID=UPI00247353D4|nr:M23 family metallopeptidase [Parabacteroides sp. PF5-9]MDH6356633.1 murein DD-endopeptidase MepM/ murein hydrolase activator NlpD [Parabacteroides sp. PF5-9]